MRIARELFLENGSRAILSCLTDIEPIRLAFNNDSTINHTLALSSTVLVKELGIWVTISFCPSYAEPIFNPAGVIYRMLITILFLFHIFLNPEKNDVFH